jgi:hypothetical protein
MTLQGPARFLVYVDDLSFRVAWQIDTNVHHDFSHFFVDFGL